MSEAKGKPGALTPLEQTLVRWHKAERARRGQVVAFGDIYAHAIRLGSTTGPTAFRYRWLELLRMERADA